MLYLDKTVVNFLCSVFKRSLIMLLCYYNIISVTSNLYIYVCSYRFFLQTLAICDVETKIMFIIFLILKYYILYFQLWIRLKMSKKKKVSEENGKSIFGIEFAPFLIPLGISYSFGFIWMYLKLTPFVLHIFLPTFQKKRWR